MLPGVHHAAAAHGRVEDERRGKHAVQRGEVPGVAHGAVDGASRHRRPRRRDVLQGGAMDRRFRQRTGDEPARRLPIRPRRRLPIGASPNRPMGPRCHGGRVAKHGVGRMHVRRSRHRVQRAPADPTNRRRALRRQAAEQGGVLGQVRVGPEADPGSRGRDRVGVVDDGAGGAGRERDAAGDGWRGRCRGDEGGEGGVQRHGGHERGARGLRRDAGEGPGAR